jgi:hypothetical protein
MEQKFSSKEMLLDISSMRSRAIDLLKEGKEYNTLLATITEKDYYYDDSISLPSIKELSERTGLKYDLIRKQLKQIYEDLLPLSEDSRPFEFQEILFSFYVKGYKNSLFWDISGLSVAPRVGEEIRIPFFKVYLGGENFYVEEIEHVFGDNRHTIEISLKPGGFNLYWHYRKDKAAEEGELSIHDIIFENDYTLKKKLDLGRFRR